MSRKPTHEDGIIYFFYPWQKAYICTVAGWVHTPVFTPVEFTQAGGRENPELENKGRHDLGRSDDQLFGPVLLF